ncbi:calcium-binding protein, partial [Nostoc sp. FACHB-110]|uniref:calcium-binding protein n=1 Tax=Nostoc sp. FACHB-110 TaxID=2692834 RepID=UPI001687AD24
MAYIPGSNQDDNIKGTSGDDIIETFAGDDLVNVTIRYDQLVLNGVIYDIPIILPGDDGGGNDIIRGGIGSDYLSGGTGNDSVNGDAGNDILWGGLGNDTLNGGDGDDIINGHYEYYVYNFDGQDYLGSFLVRDDDPGNDTINGGTGNDIIYAGNGREDIDGGAGSDTLYLNTTAYTTNLTILFTNAANPGTVSNGTQFRGIENISVTTGIGSDTINLSAFTTGTSVNSGAGNDIITGGVGDDNLNGEAGNDTINGGAGNDYLSGGAGNDSLNGGTGDDRLYGDQGVDTINGGDGDDSIYVVNSVDQVDGGTGFDFLDIDTTSITSNVTILYTSASTGGTISDGITTRTIKNIEDAR